MNYLFTCAGEGSRFIKQGLKPPKPLIKVYGDELLIWSMRSFDIKPSDTVFIVSQSKHRCKNILDDKICRLYPDINIKWLELDKPTNGQLITAIKAIELFQIDGELLIHNCDTFFNYKKSNIQPFISNDNGLYGYMPIFFGEGTHWSFARTAQNSTKIVEISEKKRISSNCSIGTYIFRSAKEFCNDANYYISQGLIEKDLGEYYIAPFLNHVLSKGKSIEIIEAKDPKLYGTLEELISSFEISFYSLLGENSWSGNQRKTLVVDIDGTLCESSPNNDYSKCEPIISCVDYLKREDKEGSYIILFTARNMRTFNGSIGLINKFTAPTLVSWLNKYSIPYDELIFGKPWGRGGVSYLDDKNIDLKNIYQIP